MTPLCRISGQPLSEIISFGSQPLGNGFISTDGFDQEYFYPMSVGFCERSMLFQLIEQPNPDRMFHDNYAFYSSTSRHMENHFREFYESVIAARYASDKSAFVVELGCNDGIMLKHFASANYRHLGIEPSKNVAAVANQNGVRTVSDFFCESLAKTIVESEGHADVFLAANVMCHIPNMLDVIAGIDQLLKATGVVIFEDPYLGDVIEKTSYDQIYDEHVFLFSGHSVRHMFEKFGFELIDLLPQATHGGSMRYVLARKGAYPVGKSVSEILKDEKDAGLHERATFELFRERVENSRQQLKDLLTELKEQGHSICGYGATSKSTTILNYCGIGPDLIDYISDTTPIKQGKFSPGVHIPVRSHESFIQNPTDYAVLFAWNHAKEIMDKETDFVRNGGKWIVHVPEVKVIG